MRCKTCGRFMTSNAPYNTPRGSNGEWFCTNPECVDSGYMLHIGERLAEVLKKSGVTVDELASVLAMKICSNCGKTKPLIKFYLLRGTNGDRYTSWCKECTDYYISNTSVGAN